jgi:hypothetical protein
MVAVLALLWPAVAPAVPRSTAAATGAAPTIAFALLPTVLGIGGHHDGDQSSRHPRFR